MSGLHVVWDWNGTLLDDLAIVVEALNVGIAKLGREPIDQDSYRDHFTRPVRRFYESLLAREVTDEEWEELNDTFHVEYYARVDEAALTVDALDAIARAETLGWTQSILSMSVHHHLVDYVESRGLAGRFRLVEGLRIPTGGLKGRHLVGHLAAMGVAPERAVIIGDTPDDAAAAGEAGAGVILYDGGSHHLLTLRAIGAPVAHTLLEAVEIAATMA